MQVLGYSERGVINSFFYEMAYHKDSTKLFNKFLEQINPMIKGVTLPTFVPVDTPKIFIEPSFSDFGDADVVIMFKDEKKGNTVLFVEAKVCAEKPWDLLSQEINPFALGLSKLILGLKPEFSSTLLIQLYRKHCLMTDLTDLIAHKRIHLPLSPKGKPGSLKPRHLGNNSTVHKVCNQIKSFENVYYISLLPSDTVTTSPLTILPLPKTYGIPIPSGSSITPFDSPIVLSASSSDYTFQSMAEKLGYITWGDIHKLVFDTDMKNTMAVFDLNQKISTDDLFKPLDPVKPDPKDKNQIYNPK